MADKISDLSGEEREQRIAELKRRMQDSAKRNRAAQGEAPAETPATDSPAPQLVVEEAGPPNESPAVDTPEENLPATETETPTTETPPTTVAAAVPAVPSANGSKPTPSAEPEGPTNADMNRREFLTYAWGAALGLLVLEGGVLSFQFMYPRFKAGEFGGMFTLGPVTAMPDSSASPQANTDGKFWLVTTQEDEPKALYMVCTHLGCLYQWVESNSRFECPCHGSKFTHDGYYIEGPAPRSLDYFDTQVVEGIVVVDTGSRNLGESAGDSPAAEDAA